MDFEGKVAIVTGGAGGIGRATALALAGRGARVGVIDRDEAGCAETIRLIEAAAGSAWAHPADVTRSGDVQAYVAAALDRHGRIDCFFNNAGIEGVFAPIHEVDEAAFDAVIAVNLKGAFLGLRHVLPVMVRQRAGSVVTTSSIAGIRGSAGLAPYAASKHGVVGLTRSAALDVGAFGVRVNAVCPGPIDTRMIRSIDEQRLARTPGAAPQSPTSFGVVDDVANLVLFLLSDLAGNVTGASYVTDGGRTAASAAVSLIRD